MKVFDSIIFFNELELLEMRLNILNDVVDHFVLTESPFTVSGNEKPLYYQENKDRFAKFNDKITHHITEEIPNDFSHMLEKTKFHVAYKEPDPYGTPMIDIPIRFQRALFNRNNSAFGIEKANPASDDMIITSDADEILDPRVLQNMDWFDGYNHYVALQRTFYYQLNVLREEDWMGSRICNWFKLRNTSVDQLRQSHQDSYRIEQGGWHWSYFGHINTIEQKLKACADSHHGSEDLPEMVDMGKDPVGRSDLYGSVPIDDSFPEYIRNNQEKYSHFIKPWN